MTLSLLPLNMNCSLQKQQENNIPEPFYDLHLVIFLFTPTVTFESWWFIPSASHSQLDQQQQQKSNKNNIHLKRWDLLDCRIFDFHYHRPLDLSFGQASEIHFGNGLWHDSLRGANEQVPRNQLWFRASALVAPAAVCAGSRRRRETALGTVEKLHS